MVKVISLSNEAYEKLRKLKRNLSFSGIVIELIEGKKKKDLNNFVGVISDSYAEEMKKKILKNRKYQNLREVKF